MTDIAARIRHNLDVAIRGSEEVMNETIAADACFHISAPIGRLSGHEAIRTGWFDRLTQALTGAHRRDMIFLRSKDYLEPGDHWLACAVHYVGNFTAPICGVSPSNSLVFFSAGEFYRIENGMISEARIIFDLPDLMQQTGQPCFPLTYGVQRTFPAPATQDGIFPRQGDSDKSHEIMTRMLRDLIAYDPETKTSKGMIGEGGAWHDEMMWYGPAGIGATYRWDGFVKDHRGPFLDAFPTRDKGETVCSLADHNYAAICGFGMPMAHSGEYFGLKPTGKEVTLPVMDFYRIQDDRLIENWVFLDYVDLFMQMGVNLITGEGWP